MELTQLKIRLLPKLKREACFNFDRIYYRITVGVKYYKCKVVSCFIFRHRYLIINLNGAISYLWEDVISRKHEIVVV
jgi:hypothetical protein